MRKSFFARENGAIHVCGHRGNSMFAPENTLAALRATRAAGGTSVEIDVLLNGDGDIIVLHDLLVDRTTDGTGAAADLSAADIARLDAGGWFDEKFAGERIPTFRQVLDAAVELDLVIEAEVKEKRDPAAFARALKAALADPADMDRLMMISFDHAYLKGLKADIPGLRTGGIVHERYGDPVAVCRAADLDEACIDLAMYHRDDARALHDAGISIRCHAYNPERLKMADRAGISWSEELAHCLRAGLIDTLSGDDVSWLRRTVDAAVS